MLLIKSCGADDRSESVSPSATQSTAGAGAGTDGAESILSPEDGSAEIAEKKDFGIEELAIEESLPQNCMKDVKLYIAQKYGKPSVVTDGPDPKYEIEGDAQQFVPVVIGTKEPPRITIQPTPSPAPSSGISVINPKAGSVLTIGSKFTLEWKIESGRNITVDVLLSTDGGKSFKAIEKGIANSSKLDITIPDNASDSCLFRVNAWAGTVFWGYNNSPVFGISAPPAITPSPTAPPEPKAPELSTEDGEFILSTGDTVRSFYLEHELDGADHAVWQISATQFSCDAETDYAAPGLIASGVLPVGETKFDIDFAAILSNYGAAENEVSGDEAVENKGNDFDLVAGVALAEQAQRVLFIRTLLYDEDDEVLGVTGSGLQVIYGRPTLDLSAAAQIGFESEYEPPMLSAKTIPGFATSSYEEIPDKGLYIFKSDLFDKGFSVEGIPGDSVEMYFQIADKPFKTVTQSDYRQPEGLLYQIAVPELTYTTTTKYYNVSFADFAPELKSIGDGTIGFYIRMVCFVPGPSTGTVIPVVSKTGRVVFTGNYAVFLAGNFDPDDLPPEEVTVKSYVPYTDFQRYIPVEWAIKDAEEYFEVTRPIQAEEMAFYIKNNKTGDFLYPYDLHRTLYPGTTREEYQEVLDRMLPPGAWFHLSITQSGWDAFWSDFFDLLSRIYNNIREAYNDLKITVANTVADRFEFLGPDVQSVIRSSVTALIDYGLASVGLPPTLPNFEELADQGLDYCVRVALDETAKSMGVPVDEIPADVRDAISDEISQQFDRLESLKHVNPLNVDYLKPATQAMYRPAYVDVKIMNPYSNDKASPTGTLTLSYYPPGKPHFKIYKYVCLPVPSLEPGESTFIRVYLTLGNTELPVYKDYYWGDTGECEFRLNVEYDVPDVETAAKEQGVEGESALYPDSYVYDVSPHFEYRKINTPCEDLFD